MVSKTGVNLHLLAIMLNTLQRILEGVNMKQPPQHGKALKRL